MMPDLSTPHLPATPSPSLGLPHNIILLAPLRPLLQNIIIARQLHCPGNLRQPIRPLISINFNLRRLVQQRLIDQDASSDADHVLHVRRPASAVQCSAAGRAEVGGDLLVGVSVCEQGSGRARWVYAIEVRSFGVDFRRALHEGEVLLGDLIGLEVGHAAVVVAVAESLGGCPVRKRSCHDTTTKTIPYRPAHQYRRS